MKKLFALLFLSIINSYSFGQTSKDGGIAIIPEPVTLVKNNGEFILPKNVIIVSSTQPEMKQVNALLRNRFSISTGAKVTITDKSPTATIRLILNTKVDTLIGVEGYRLTVTSKGIVIKANKPAGLFYGAQTLLQLFPSSIVSATRINNVKWTSPCVQITDYPRFKWRGLMFDVARHFFTKAEVEHYIDNMVKYKYNLLHLHLTDDEGWRIEIKSLPRLTSVGAYNAKKVGYFGTFAAPAPNEPRNYGGFYTQEDIKEIVKYAQERFVNILPEIDVPGHSLAAIAAYPELSCTAGADKYQVRSGEEIMDWSKTPVNALIDNTLCPANERVYVFLDKVLTEVAQLFPFGYIHMGGDECAKNFWEKSDAIKALMQKEGLKNQEEVQSYFEKRIEKIVESKGKKFLGWDEILEGGLAHDAIVMSWRGMKGGIEAAKLGHEVVMSPTNYAYLDYMNGDPAIEPKVYATLRLNKTYEFDPAPEGIDQKLVIGGQANLWTEQVYNTRHLEYMTWPRAFAIAEAVWSPKSRRNWDDFFSRVEKHFDRFNVEQIKYAPSVYDPIFTVKSAADSVLHIEMRTEAKGLAIHYSVDNSFPDQFYPKYTEPIIFPKEAAMLKVITYKGDKPVGRMIVIPVEELKKRAARKINYE